MPKADTAAAIRSRSLVLLLLVAAAIRLWVAWQPVELLVNKNLPDDAFYYFSLARNLAESGRATVDGINPTNGFHPLWLLAVTPIFAAFPQPLDLPVHLALSLASLFDLVSIVLIVRLAARLGGQARLGLAAAWLYALNPFVILQVTNGLETSLGILTLMLFLTQFEAWLADAGRRAALLLGMVGGLMLLARTDSAFLLGLALLAAIWLQPRRQRLRSAAWVAAASLVVLLPWLLWSQAAVGVWVQESGLAIPYAIRARLAMEHGPGLGPQLAAGWAQLTNTATWLRGDFTGLPLAAGLLLWALVLPGLRRTSPPERAISLSLLASGVVLVFFHAGLRWYPRLWYFVPLSVAFALCAAVWMKANAAHPRRIQLFVGVTSLYFVLVGTLVWQVGFYPWQREMWAAKNWLSENVPAGSRAASFNSGIYTYYSQATVINLDGVVNHNAFVAIQQRELLAYMQLAGVNFLVDTDNAIFAEFGPFMGAGFPEQLDEVAVITPDAGYGLGALRVYHLGD